MFLCVRHGLRQTLCRVLLQTPCRWHVEEMHYLHRLDLYSLRGCLCDNIHLYNLFLLYSVLGLLESSSVLVAYI